MKEKNKAIEFLISAGSNLTGTAAGSALGFLIAGPGGAIIGGAVGSTVTDILKNIGQEVVDKKLSMAERQLVRSGAVYSFAVDKIKKNFESGTMPVDGFFDSDTTNERTTAEELLEAVLVKAKDEYEEKKIKFLGNLYGNIAFRSGFSKQTFNQLINIASNLTYRQYCILAMIKNIEKYNLRQEDYRKQQIYFPAETMYFMQEIFDLYNINMIRCVQENSPDSEVFFGLTDIAPGRLRLQWIGEKFYELLNLNEIDESEILSLISMFQHLENEQLQNLYKIVQGKQ